MRIWEHGAGATLACGTGACAVVVAAVLEGRSERNCTLDLPGGPLEIEWREEDNHIYMTGQVHDWILQNIEAALEQKITSKEGGSPVAADQDILMADSGPSCEGRSQSYVEGISKISVVKQASDLKGSSVKVLNCQDAVVYILAPLKYATVYGCSDA